MWEPILVYAILKSLWRMACMLRVLTVLTYTAGWFILRPWIPVQRLFSAVFALHSFELFSVCYAIFGDSNFILAEYIPENPSSRIYVHDSLKIVYRHAWWCDHFHRVWLSHHVAYKAGIWLRFCVYSMAHGPFNGVSYLNLKSEDAAVDKKAIYINIINAGDSDVKSRMITTHNVTQCNL